MPFLTLQDGKNDLKALAIVKGGDYNNEFLYLNESDEKNPVKKHRNEINALEYIKDLKKMKNAFYAFAESVEKEPIIYNTRYGTGILQK